MDDISVIVVRFVFSQTNPVFKPNPVFIDISIAFATVYSHSVPLDFYLCSTDFEVHPMPLRLFNKSQ